MIEYTVNDNIYYTKRSFGEFQLLYDEVTRQWPHDEFSPFPSKNEANISHKKLIDSRIKAFSGLLKSMCDYDPLPPFLNDFLLPYEEVPDFTQIVHIHLHLKFIQVFTYYYNN